MSKKKSPGRPPSQYKLENEKFEAEDFFLYVPKDTLVSADINRFLTLCDNMVMELNLEEVTSSDLNAIALYNRAQIYSDMIFRSMASLKCTDTSLVKQLAEFTKEKEKHLENLKLRRQDRVTNDDIKNSVSITQIALEHDHKPEIRESKKTSLAEEKKEFREKHPDIDPFVFVGRKKSPKKMDE